MSDSIRARFVVHRATEWAEFVAKRYFLKYLTPDWDESEDADDPVAQLLYEVKSDAIPADFDFTHKDKDSMSSTMFGEEGIEIELHDENLSLEIGAIVDMEIRVIGRVEFQ